MFDLNGPPLHLDGSSAVFESPYLNATFQHGSPHEAGVNGCTVEDVIDMANDTEFGLASYFYARDLSRVFKVAEALDYGMVGINTGLISTEVAPFGGVKQSGFGREGSKYGIEDYLDVKYLCLSV